TGAAGGGVARCRGRRISGWGDTARGRPAAPGAAADGAGSGGAAAGTTTGCHADRGVSTTTARAGTGNVIHPGRATPGRITTTTRSGITTRDAGLERLVLLGDYLQV